jgi:Fe2+ or Zn2+ uptake regulation protein
MKCNSCWDILSFASDSICKQIFVQAKKLSFHIDEHSLSILWKCKNCI